MRRVLIIALFVGQLFFSCLTNVLAQGAPCGTVLATYRGIPAKSNGQSSSPNACVPVRGTYGYQYECVEYIKRFYAEALSVDTKQWWGNAVDYFDSASDKGLASFPNGGTTQPAPDDIIVFDNGNNLGHVAIVASVTANTVTCIEENWSKTGNATLTLTFQNGVYTIQPRGSYQILGWLRPVPTEVVVQPGPDTGKDIWTTSVFSYANCSGPGPGGGLYDTELRTGGWGDLYYSLLQFDLSGLPPHAKSAVLYLYCYSLDNNGTGTPMYLDRITQFWWDWQTSGSGCDHDRLWWADRPPTVQWTTTTLPTPVAGQWYTVNITDLYNAWQGGQYPNYGLQLRPVQTADTFNFFYTSRYIVDPTLRPKLVVQP